MDGSDESCRIIVGHSQNRKLQLLATFVASFLGIAFASGCGGSNGLPPGALLGEAGVYNYSPSALQIGNVQQFWWCGQAHNPENPSQFSDTIRYASIDVTTHRVTGPVTVLGETPGAWDSVYTCNPKVVGGTFVNPLGDGQTYSYAMYYVGTASTEGLDNSIGVAFSADGVHWKKYGQPVIPSTSLRGYGVGQPALYNSDQKAGIWLFFEDNRGGGTPTQHVKAVSTDGVHFSIVGNLSMNGLGPETWGASWGDMAYDLTTGYWYAAFNLPWRSPSTTGNIVEQGQLGVELYRIPDSSLMTGTTPWQLLKTFDTNLLGNESIFIPGFLRDQYGSLNVGTYPKIQLFTSISAPAPHWDASPSAAGKSAQPQYWDIGTATWVPDTPLSTLTRYANASTHEVTTGWIDPAGGFKLQAALGHLYESPQQGANVPFYGCKNGSMDYFISTDRSCGGMRLLGLNGYGYSQTQPGLNLVPLYSCFTGHDHFVSQDPHCEGEATSATLLGYALP